MVPREELEAVQDRLDQVTLRLVDAYRQLFLKLSEAERPVFLIELIGSARPSGEAGANQEQARPPLPHQIRELAYDLAAAEVVSARPLGPEFVEAAASGLTDPQAQIRTKAASLLAKLDASTIMDQVRHALRNEKHTDAIVAMLSIITRHPSHASISVVLDRLDPEHQPVPVLIASLDAMLAIFGTEPIENQKHLAKIRKTLDALSADQLTPNAIRLRARLGDLEVVRAHIASRNEQISRAAAQALVGDPESLQAILAEAARSSALFEIAGEAIRNHDPTASGYSQAAELPAPSTEKRTEVLVRIAATLPPGELLKVVSMPMELTERERLLSVVATPAELEKLADQDYRTEDRRLLIESLSRTRLQLKNPTGALKVIESIPADSRSVSLVQDEITALIWLNRLDEAAQRSGTIAIPQSIEVWFATLEKIESLDHAPSALTRCSDIFAENFTPEQQERFGVIAQRVASLRETPQTPEDLLANEQATSDSPERGPVNDPPGEGTPSIR